MKTLRVELPLWYRLTPWIFVAFIVGQVFFGLTPPDSVSFWLKLSVLGAIAVYVFLGIGYLEMNETFIRHTSRMGRFQMAWDEIERIETWDYVSVINKLEEKPITDLPYETWEGMVLFSKTGRLAITCFRFWSGADKAAMIELFNRKIRERPIPTKPDNWARYKSSKGTQIDKASHAIKRDYSHRNHELIDLLKVNYSNRFNSRGVMLLILLMALSVVVSLGIDSQSPNYAVVIYTWILLVAGSGRVEMNDTVIRLTSFYKYEMRWDEVVRVEMPDSNSREMVFYGQDLVLSIGGPDRWKGDDKAAMIELCNRQIETLGIPLVREVTFKSRPCENTKVDAEGKSFTTRLREMYEPKP